MSEETDQPIVVGSGAGEQLGAAVRSLLAVIAGWMVGKGWIDSDIATAAVPVIALAVPFIWGQLRVRKSVAQRRVMADALPDDLAVTK